jgi:hypothetical protein
MRVYFHSQVCIMNLNIVPSLFWSNLSPIKGCISHNRSHIVILVALLPTNVNTSLYLLAACFSLINWTFRRNVWRKKYAEVDIGLMNYHYVISSTNCLISSSRIWNATVVFLVLCVNSFPGYLVERSDFVGIWCCFLQTKQRYLHP